jgi:hypothetical protein
MIVNEPLPGETEQVIQRFVELSAEAQAKRREMEKDSPAFRSLTEAILTYGKILALLAALQEIEEVREPEMVVESALASCVVSSQAQSETALSRAASPR